MKKIFVIATALLMCCMVMGCGVKAQLVGTWKSSDSYEVSASDMYDYYDQSVKTDITFTINKDGTFAWDEVTNTTYTVNMDAVEDMFGDLGITIPSKDAEKKTTKFSGSWYYHDSDKVILKVTKYSEQYDDEEADVDNKRTIVPSEVVLVDDILFVTHPVGYKIVEFTKAK